MCYTQKTNFCCGQKTNFSSATHTLPSITWHCTIPDVFQSQSENQWTFNSWAQVDRSGTFLFGICFRHELFVCPRISYDLMLEIRCENLCRQTGFSDSRIIILFAKSISDQKKWFVYLCAMSAKKWRIRTSLLSFLLQCVLFGVRKTLQDIRWLSEQVLQRSWTKRRMGCTPSRVSNVLQTMSGSSQTI